MIDTHAHLHFPQYDVDRDEVLRRTWEAGLSAVINIGTSLESTRKAVALALTDGRLWATAGVHPHDTECWSPETRARLKDLAREEKIRAVGEIGLDYVRNNVPHPMQQRAFREQLELAAELGLPAIVHVREAWTDASRILADFPALPMVMHCFSLPPDEVPGLLAQGRFLSFAGNVTFPKAESLRAAARLAKVEQLLLETDCPYLAPQEKRGQRNEPAFLHHIVPELARCLGLSQDDVIRVTTDNARRFFRLPEAESTVQGETLAYPIRDSYYLNLTNRCPNHCIFCSRADDPLVKGHWLRLTREPSAAELLAALPASPAGWREAVFCGYGEPTLRLEVLKEVAATLKKRGWPKIRLNTNGLGSLVAGRNIVPELAGLIDEVSISLNAHREEIYHRLCRPETGPGSFEGVKEFIREARKTIPSVTATVVEGVPEVDVEACAALVRELGVNFRRRRLGGTG